MRNLFNIFLFIVSLFLLSSCNIVDEFLEDEAGKVGSNNELVVKSISELQNTANFRNGALAHILEGELNRRGQAVGYHYDQLPTKKGQIIKGTESDLNEYGVYEAKVEVEGVEKTSNNGMSTFFPDHWSAQEVVDSINEAYESKSYLTGNTYEGLSSEGVTIRMYLTDDEKIISAFPIY